MALLSIIIPTKNRQKFVTKAIKQILQFDYENFELIIQDNSDQDILREEVKKYANDSRLVYHYDREPLSFTKTFSTAISLSTGEYICMLGDDDGVLNDIFKITEWAKENNIDAVIPDINVVYFWPKSNSLNEKMKDGYMYVTRFNNNIIFCDAKQEICKLLDSGAQGYFKLNLVKVYHGLVKKERLEQVKDILGDYIKGLTPDIYSAVCLSLVCERTVKLKRPISISGICNASGSASSMTGGHTGKFEDMPHLRGHESYEWSEEVPRFYSVDTVWADSALAAIRDMHNGKMNKNFNKEALYMYCLWKYPQYKGEILKSARRFGRTKYLKIGEMFIKYVVFDWIIRAIKKIFRPKTAVYKVYQVEDILKASEKTEEYIIERNVSWNKSE